MMLSNTIPIHRSLTQVILLGGVLREIAILNATFIAAMALGLHNFYIIPVGIIIHVVAQQAAKKDPQFFATFKRQLWQKSFYAV